MLLHKIQIVRISIVLTKSFILQSQILVKRLLNCSLDLYSRHLNYAVAVVNTSKQVFWILHGVKNCRTLIDLCKQIFRFAQSYLLSKKVKTKLVSASFSLFSGILWKKVWLTRHFLYNSRFCTIELIKQANWFPS